MAAWRQVSSAVVATVADDRDGPGVGDRAGASQPPTARVRQTEAAERAASSPRSTWCRWSAVVRDRKGRFVPDLSQRDFIVVESGQTRPIVGFKAEADGPVRLAIVFDVSGSMRVGTKAADAREAARQMLSALGGSDQAALFSFDTKLETVRDFTSDFASLDRGARTRSTRPTARRRCMTRSRKRRGRSAGARARRSGCRSGRRRRADRRRRHAQPAQAG